MIVPSKNQKTYGVIHTENYFSFLGFCKKVNSDKIQKVDIFLNDTLIDTIVADKHIEKIEDIYELEGFGFNYILPNEYIGQKKISFKNHETKEDLQNSPYELIDETHPKFNEARFLNSLEKPIDEKRIRDMYCPNSIGFLATEENLEDDDFMKYIQKYLHDFPNSIFKAFYINIENINFINIMFATHTDRIELIPLKNIYDLAQNVEIMLCNEINAFDKFVLNKNISIYCTNILVIYIYLPHSKLKLSDYDQILKDSSHPILKYPEKFNLNENHLREANYSVTKIFENMFKININDSTLVEDFYYYQFIKLTLDAIYDLKKWHLTMFREIYK